MQTYTVSLQTGPSVSPTIRACYYKIYKRDLPAQIESMVETAVRKGWADYFRVVCTGD